MNDDRHNRPDVERIMGIDVRVAHRPNRAPESGSGNGPPPLRIAEVPAPTGDDTTSDAFHGVAGEFVRAVMPFTEADPWAVLVSFLAAFGSVVGPSPHDSISGSRHTARIWPVLVGQTGSGRKGTSFDAVRMLFDRVDSGWVARHTSNAASGEAIIWEVRDFVTGTNSRETVTTDPGVDDKRLFILESEFASPLRVAGRDGSILSPVIRQAWDGGTLRHMAKHSPAHATGAHIVILGHITMEELRRETNALDQANGFLNRFLFLQVGRSKLLPRGDAIPVDVIDQVAGPVAEAVRHARDVGPVTHAESFWEVYEPRYDGLTAHGDGLAGAVLGRGAPQVRRLALIYALLDGTDVLDGRHATAALDVWDRCAASARDVFGTRTGDSRADRLITALRNSPEGMTRTDVRDLFGRNVAGETIDRMLQTLIDGGRIVESTRPTDGRSATVYDLTTETTEATQPGYRNGYDRSSETEPFGRFGRTVVDDETDSAGDS